VEHGRPAPGWSFGGLQKNHHKNAKNKMLKPIVIWTFHFKIFQETNEVGNWLT
jgi:hypothetical protein